MLDIDGRVLMNDGTSIITDEVAIELLLTTGEIPEYMKVIPSKDSKKFNIKFQTDVEYNDEAEQNIHPDETFDEQAFDALCDKLWSEKRDNTHDELHQRRINKELDYLEKYKQQHFILQVSQMIDKFRRDGVVWGVGRGSSCASYILFLLGVHDVNPITYDINPSEFYKHIEE